MIHRLEEIQNNLFQSQFHVANRNARKLLAEIPLIEKGSPETIMVKEVFTLTRFFLTRSERISKLTPGKETADTFLFWLNELKSKSYQGWFFNGVVRYCHARIADALQKELAGQKSYQLNFNNLLQLIHSLVIIGNYSSAKETIQFAKKLNEHSAKLYFLSAFCHYHFNEVDKFEINFRDGLLYSPEELEGLENFIPEGKFHKIWSKIVEMDLEFNVPYRLFGMFCEIHNLFFYKRSLIKNEVSKILSNLKRLEKELCPEHRPKVLPRLIQLALVIADYGREKENSSLISDMKHLVSQFDKDSWQTWETKRNF